MKLIHLIIFLLAFLNLAAQKHDNNWIFGSSWNKSRVDFNDNPPSINLASGPVNFISTNAIISDASGQLQLYSNGAYLANSLNQILPNSSGFNDGLYTQMYKESGLQNPQGVLILPGNGNNYHVIHETLEFPGTFHPTDIIVNKIRWTEVSMDNPEGAILRMNHEILIDTLNIGGLTACKHANGRDWWVLCSKYNSRKIFALLVTPDSVFLANEYEISEPLLNGLAQSCFSPDGNYFARYVSVRYEEITTLQVFDFDRCSGLLSNQKNIELQDSVGSTGLAFAPNSKLLYVSSYDKVFQIDLTENHLPPSIDTVAIYDGFLGPFPTTFYMAQLAPNGKIYITPNNGSRYLHVIEKPNVKGTGCEVRQHSFDLIRQNSFSMPNLPNFRLGRLEGSVCDTLYSFTPNLLDESLVSVFPNPTSDYVQINWPEDFQISQLRLLDFAGNEMVKISQGLHPPFRLEMGDFAPGMYWLVLESEEGKWVYRKVVRF